MKFLSRHLEEEGIFYFFRESYQRRNGTVSGEQILAIGDRDSGYSDIKVKTSEDEEVSLRMRFFPTANVLPEHTVLIPNTVAGHG